jgi:hypothetical protein
LFSSKIDLPIVETPQIMKILKAQVSIRSSSIIKAMKITLTHHCHPFNPASRCNFSAPAEISDPNAADIEGPRK